MFDTGEAVRRLLYYMTIISIHYESKLFGGNIGVLFYDVTTLYFEADYEDDLRKTGFS